MPTIYIQIVIDVYCLPFIRVLNDAMTIFYLRIQVPIHPLDFYDFFLFLIQRKRKRKLDFPGYMTESDNDNNPLLLGEPPEPMCNVPNHPIVPPRPGNIELSRTLKS